MGFNHGGRLISTYLPWKFPSHMTDMHSYTVDTMSSVNRAINTIYSEYSQAHIWKLFALEGKLGFGDVPGTKVCNANLFGQSNFLIIFPTALPLATNVRPAEWSQWATKSRGGNRWYDDIPFKFIHDSAEFGIAVTKWWYEMQPAFWQGIGVVQPNARPCHWLRKYGMGGNGRKRGGWGGVLRVLRYAEPGTAKGEWWVWVPAEVTQGRANGEGRRAGKRGKR